MSRVLQKLVTLSANDAQAALLDLAEAFSASCEPAADGAPMEIRLCEFGEGNRRVAQPVLMVRVPAAATL